MFSFVNKKVNSNAKDQANVSRSPWNVMASSIVKTHQTSKAVQHVWRTSVRSTTYLRVSRSDISAIDLSTVTIWLTRNDVLLTSALWKQTTVNKYVLTPNKLSNALVVMRTISTRINIHVFTRATITANTNAVKYVFQAQPKMKHTSASVHRAIHWR